MSMKVLLCISGASGVIYGYRLLKALSEMENVEPYLVVSEAARGIMDLELDVDPEKITALAKTCYEPDDMGAPPASGSALYDAVVIAPCSVSTLSKVAAGIGDNLITRAAAVALKEGKKLILVPRETPLSIIHLQNMVTVSSAGGTMLPASPAFYGNPKTIEDMVDHVVGKILDSMGLENQIYPRWEADHRTSV